LTSPFGVTVQMWLALFPGSLQQWSRTTHVTIVLSVNDGLIDRVPTLIQQDFVGIRPEIPVIIVEDRKGRAGDRVGGILGRK
jgi:hypothetical protein